jgi:trans-aconitate 2-methyltransferase
MNTEKDWDPQLYLKYKNERTRPSEDLIGRIKLLNPATIIDVGCGPGNSTQILAERWPKSKITGIDSSQSMIEKARQDFPDHEWIIGDAACFEHRSNFDIVFSNATIQWIPDHEKLIPKLASIVNKGGALAIQVPMFNKMPLSEAIERIAGNRRWKSRLDDCSKLFTYHNTGFYYDILYKLSPDIDLWITTYIHILDSHDSMIEWIGSTGMKPYIDRLDLDEEKKIFENEVLTEIKKCYPEQADMKVLFPFQRLFFIVYL